MTPPSMNFDGIVCLAGLSLTAFLIQLHRQRLFERKTKRHLEEDDILKQKKSLETDIAFYENRKRQLVARSGKRDQLSTAARELGGLLDPGDIQSKLLETAQALFPGKPIQISIGQNPDAIDRYILQRKQPVLAPNQFLKTHPIIASPIFSQGEVAGILRVGGVPDADYSHDDLRLLDILTSLATSALQNCFLFAQVQESALRDGLTGLSTRRSFQEQLDSAILESSRYGHTLSVILSDVDHFKSINDTYGHQAGDQVLQGFAHVLVRHVRDVDIVARYGGEEFIILLLQKDHEEAIAIAEDIRVDLEAQRFEAGGKIISITGSFGVATFPKEATSAKQLVRMADERLYAAKKNGRNQVYGRAA